MEHIFHFFLLSWTLLEANICVKYTFKISLFRVNNETLQCIEYQKCFYQSYLLHNSGIEKTIFQSLSIAGIASQSLGFVSLHCLMPFEG